MSETYSHKLNLYCEQYTCANCPMRRGYYCMYEYSMFIFEKRKIKV